MSSSPFFSIAATSLAPLDLQLTRIPFGSVSGLTMNQRRVGEALEGQYSTGATGNAATLYGNLLASPFGDELTEPPVIRFEAPLVIEEEQRLALAAGRQHSLRVGQRGRNGLLAVDYLYAPFGTADGDFGVGRRVEIGRAHV